MDQEHPDVLIKPMDARADVRAMTGTPGAGPYGPAGFAGGYHALAIQIQSCALKEKAVEASRGFVEIVWRVVSIAKAGFGAAAAPSIIRTMRHTISTDIISTIGAGLGDPTLHMDARRTLLRSEQDPRQDSIRYHQSPRPLHQDPLAWQGILSPVHADQDSKKSCGSRALVPSPSSASSLSRTSSPHAYSLGSRGLLSPLPGDYSKCGMWRNSRFMRTSDKPCDADD